MAPTLQARFESNVDRSGEHHLWLGSVNASRGTGQLKVDGRIVTAHRVAWQLERGPVPQAQRVRSCAIEPVCVNVAHLSLTGQPATVIANGHDRDDASSVPRRRGTRGAGSKRQRGSGRWELAVIAGVDEVGRPTRSFRAFRGTEPEANKALALFTAEVIEAGPVIRDTAANLTVDRLIEEFRHHLDVDKGRRPATLLRYDGLQRNWISPHLGSRKADRVLPSDIDTILGHLRRDGQSQSSIHQTFTLLNGAFKWAKRNRRIPSNPCLDVEEPRTSTPSREVLPPEIDTVHRLITAALEVEFGFGVACHLAAATGMRRGELGGLRWTRIHLDDAYLVVSGTVSDVGGTVTINDFTKTRKTRRVSLDQRSIDLLTELRVNAERTAATVETLLATDAFVFTHDVTGRTPLRPELFSRRMARLRKQLGLEHAEFDATMHALRHWTQTTLSEAGYNPRQIALRGGHSEQLMNRVYVHRTNTAERHMTDYLGDLLTPDP